MAMRVAAVTNGKCDPLTMLSHDLASVFEFNDERFSVRGQDLPQWVSVIADLVDWTLPLKIAAGAYLKKIAEEAAKTHWEQRAKLYDALAEMSESTMSTVCRALFAVIDKAGVGTSLRVGLPIPNDHFGTVIAFKPESAGEVAFYLTMLLRDGAAVEAAARDIASAEQGALLGAIDVVYLDYNAIALRYWVRGGERRERRLTVGAAGASAET